MTREELLKIMRLLSALEAAGQMRSPGMPDYLYDQITDAVNMLERELLK
jgi:hypothetical protein